MTESQSRVSDTFKQSYAPHMHSPTKRTKRLYDQSHVPDIEKVFSEYDWVKQQYSSTLRNPALSSSAGASTIPAASRLSASTATSSKHTAATNRSPRNGMAPSPRPRNAVDESYISSCLLYNSLSTSSSLRFSSNRDTDTPPPLYTSSSSPLSLSHTEHDSYKSPLQEHARSYAGRNLSSSPPYACQYDFPRPRHILRDANRSPIRRRCRSPRTSFRPVSPVAESLSSSSTSYDGTGAAQCSSTSSSSMWCSDFTAVSIDDALCSEKNGSFESSPSRFEDREEDTDMFKSDFYEEESSYEPQESLFYCNTRRRPTYRLSSIDSYESTSASSNIAVEDGDLELNGRQEAELDSVSMAEAKVEEKMGCFDALGCAVRYRYAAITMKWQLGLFRLCRKLS